MAKKTLEVAKLKLLKVATFLKRNTCTEHFTCKSMRNYQFFFHKFAEKPKVSVICWKYDGNIAIVFYKFAVETCKKLPF